ncbi:Calmodulin [Hondaea fermentalgiana]|uniref:Calmodulin n=1 Tax=Hondaea fermentalgiana TaxID=2315210 RepID=A0A2R5GRQ9_9STRA|nr:Calmodulin [Hondaea fermentalgiana]|eukprot:GBG31323.1 Calmodulin [Hondaea fermentalgiana]
MLAHVQGKQSVKLVSAVMDTLDTHHNGRIYFDEFVSFASYDRSELAEIAIRLRRKLKNGAKSSLYHCFGLVADPKSQLVSSSLVLTLIDEKLDFQLTPGEANWIAARIGPALANFKRFLKSNVQDLMRSWTLEDHWVSDIALSVSTKQALEHESRGLTPVQVSANLDCAATTVKSLPKFWARLAQVGDPSARNGGESDGTSEESETDSGSEDDDVDGAGSASEEEYHNDDDDGEEEEEGKSNVSDDSDADSDFAHSRKLEIAQSKTDAGLVADGFVCVETPLNGHRIFDRKPSFLWIKKEMLRYDANAAPDAVLELAVTIGRATKLTSPIWAPPSRGFKRLAFNFGPAGRQVANGKHGEEPYAGGTRALDCFLWYRKADATYAREYLADLRTSRLVARGPDDKSLQARLRERVRAQVAELRKSQGARFDPADILDAVAPHSDRLKKRQFVQGMSKLGIQLSISDLAAIFDKLDMFGANYVLREDVIDFFELSDKELESILMQLRAFLRRSKRKGESPMQIFRELDANGNGKLSARELHKLLRQMGILASLAEAQRLIDRMDTNENGAVDMDEFLDFVQRGSILGGSSARAAKISSNVRDAARTLHAISRKQAHLGTDSGRLSSKLDTRHAWQRLLGPSDEYGTILTAGRVRRILQKRGLRLRMEEVQTLLRALEPAFERVGGLTFPSFDSFVRLSEPVENIEGLWNDDGEDANADVARDADAGSGTSADLRFRSALANLHADLSMMAVSEDIDDAGLFELLFPSAGVGKVLRQQFLQGLDHVGALSRFRAASDRDRLANVFDCDPAREHGGPLRLRKRFSKLDTAGHGTISKKAFATVLRRVKLEIPRSERDALQSILLIKTGQRSRRVDYELFCDIVERSSEIRGHGVDRVHQRLGALFQHVDARPIMETFDRKGEGSLSTPDFQRALDLCGVRISKFDWSVLRPQLAQDGRINYIALCEMIETADLAQPLAKRRNRKPDEVRLFRALAEHRGALADATASTDLRRVFEVYDEPGLGVIPVSEAVSALRDLVQQCQLQGLVPLELLRSVATRYVAKEDQFDYLAFCSAFDHSAVHVADHDVFLRGLGEQIRAGFETTGLSFHQAMARYDPEGTGKLSRYAFRRSIRHDLGVRVAEHELACLMDLAETHADGLVDYLELEKKMSLQEHALVGASLVRQREVVDALRRAIDKRRRKDPFFDLRKCFRCHTGGRSVARTHELTSLLGNLGVFVSAEDVSALCSHRNVLTLDAFARFVDTDETEWDIIASRCQRRLEELSREGVIFSRECSLHRAPENASPSGISRARFVDVCRRLGMPLSASQLDLVLLRFKEPGGSQLVAFRPFVDFVQARARQVALEGLGEDFF